MSDQSVSDSYGHIDDLRWTLTLPEIKAAIERGRGRSTSDVLEAWQSLRPESVDGRDTAGSYWLVSSLGLCQIYDVPLPADITSVLPSPLPVEIVVSAFDGLVHALEHLALEARELPDKFDDAQPVEDVALCTSILHQLMQTWAAFLAVNQNYQEYLDAGGPSSGEYGKLMNRVLACFDEVDKITQSEEQVRLLSIATELPLLENWRGMLQGSFKETRPWWLDGTLERLALAAETRNSLPTNCDLCTLLMRQNEEINARQTEYSLAANSKGLARRTQADLLKARWPLADDPRVSVRFELEGAGEARELKLVLDAPVEKMQQFVSAEIALNGGAVRSAMFTLGVATFELSQADIESPITAALRTSNGRRVDVPLSENRNGG
jgi:hypothetical protein